MTPRTDPHSLWFINSRITLADAPGGVTVSEHRMAFGDAPPTHVHYREDEIFHVRSGVMRFRVGENEVVARAGDTVVAPRGLPHAFRVESAEGAVVVVVTTAADDFAGVMREFGRPAATEALPVHEDVTPEMGARLAEICLAHGLELVGPPLAAAA